VLWEHEIAGSNPAAPTTSRRRIERVQGCRPSEGNELSETASALRATSDALVRDLERLAALERKKRRMTPGDPRLMDIAGEVESLALRVLGSSVRQRELAEDAEDLVEAGSPDAPTRTIAATPREIHVILAEWRDAERRAGDADPGSPAARAAETEVERLRAEYRRAHEDAIRRRDA
jgi:hypothetical protein